MKRLLSVILLAGVFASTAFSVNLAPGSQYYYTGIGAKENSLGYTGVSELGSIDGNSYNPASLGDLRRMANSFLIGGLGTKNLLLSPGFALPTDIGVLSFTGLYLGGSQTNGLNTLLGLQANIAKPITETLFWGFGIKLNYGMMNPNFNDWQLAFDTGIIYSEKSDKKGTGFFDPSYGLVVKNIGKNITLGSYDPFPAMGIGIGASFYPVKLDAYKLKLIGDVTLPFNPFNVAVSVGVENIFIDMFKLRFAYVLSGNNFGTPSILPFTLGAGFTGKLNIVKDSPTDIDISYALQNQSFNGTNEWAHSVNVSVAWGFYDDVKPTAKVVPYHLYFSPNYDGSQDEERIALDIRDNTLVDGWQLDIRDKNNSTVKSYKSMEKLQLRTLSIPKFFEKIFSSKQQVEIPKEIVWDGKDDKGTAMPDGEYHYSLLTWDENRNTNGQPAGSIIIDTVFRKLETTASTLIFSPNGDGAKDDISFDVKTENFKDIDRFKVYVKDERSNVVKYFDYNNKVPAKIVWDGKLDDGRPAPEGDYFIYSMIENPAGNNVQTLISGIHLVTNYQTVEFDIKGAAFSPSVSGQNTLTFKTKVSDDKGLESWTFKVTDAAGKIVREIKGEKSMPAEIVWDGKADYGKVLADGDYSCDLELFFDSGNHPKTPKRTVKIDTTPPAVTVQPEFLSFSPNGDGKQDSVTFAQTLKAEDDDLIETKILEQNGSIVYYNKYEKKDFPQTFVWNGLDRNMAPLPEGRYTYVVEGTDAVGNRSVQSVKDILLKTGLEKISVQSDVPAISPANDQAVNRAVFTPTVSSRDGIVSFTLEIKDEKNYVVRSFKRDSFTNRVEWDGKDDSGRQLKDGNYYYTVKVRYNYGDEPVSASKPIRVKSVTPEIGVSSDVRIFSPNGDGVRDNIIFRQALTNNDKSDIYEAVIADAFGKPVKSYRWTGTVPKEIVWDGKADNGKPAEPGVYTYIVTGTDVARNRAVRTVENIKLVRAIEKLTIAVDNPAFSPNGDGVLDTAVITATVTSTNDLTLSELAIYDTAGNIVRLVDKTNGLIDRFAFDGKDDDGDALPDGVYRAELDAVFESGNHVQATSGVILLAGSAPQYRLVISPALFTPDNDGDNDNLTVSLEITNPAPIKSWSLNIYKKLENNVRGPVFKSFTGTDAVKKIFIWDGTSDDKQDLVEAVQDYTAVLEAEDVLGNRLTNVQRTISVGVLVEKTPEGLRIRVSSIQFAFDSAQLVGDSQAVMDKVIYIIRRILSEPKKYGITPNYKIEIGGHTDDIGADEYNQKLSERRAQSVYSYLIEKDVDPKILSSIGYGKTRQYKIITADMPKEKKEEYRARNRRVEFFIRK